MARANANGIEIEYMLSGPADGRPLLMIHGVGAQLVRWPQGLCDLLAEAGFRLLRYDSRDIGLSTHMTGAAIPNLADVTQARRQGRAPELPYTLSDLAADAAGLLTALDIPAAHILGVSLGGMVAQQLAIEFPDLVLSMTIMMSQSGNPDMPGSNPEAMAILSAPAPDPAEDREAHLRHQVRLNQVPGSPDYPTPEAELRAFAMRTADRAYHPAGAARQLAAARGAPDRRPALRALSVPTLVIHGADDPLISAVCGEDIAANIKGAWLLRINGMGHDLPKQLFDLFVSAIIANCARSGK